MKLALTQIISGVLITFFATLIVTYEMSTELVVPLNTAPPTFVDMNPGIIYYKIYILLLGLVVLGIGIVQLIRARRQSSEAKQG